jgi:large subunit ribosomal protein L9
MKVILLEDIKSLGTFSNIVNVTPGYAKNFLLRNNKAVIADPVNSKHFIKQYEKASNSHIEKKNIALEDCKILESEYIKHISHASEDGKLYGSISKQQILKILRDLNLKSKYIKVDMPTKIKDVGIFKLKISLYSEISSIAKLVVARNESEINSLLNKNNI